MKSLPICTLISFLLLNWSSAEAKAWRGIEPLHSTRTDVERLMGPQVVRCGSSACIYELDEEIAFILYASDSSCRNDSAESDWMVPVGTVIEIGIHFKEDKPFSELGFDLTKFEKVEDKHLPGWIYYVNIDEGVRVEGGTESVSGVTYFQSRKDNHLRCPKNEIRSIHSQIPESDKPLRALLIRKPQTNHLLTTLPQTLRLRPSLDASQRKC